MKNRDGKTRLDLLCLRSILAALFVVLLAGSGALSRLNGQVEDLLYQKGEDPDPRIAVVGIDAYALKTQGSWPWDRSVMADIIEKLNEDPENRPAAIGLDVIYNGETTPEADARLIEAAAPGNLVMAGMVEFTSGLVEDENGKLHMNRFKVRNPSLPFEGLREKVRTGHINAMYDNDGVLRRHLWSVELPDGETLMSFPYELYALYCQANGLEADFRPRTDENGFWRIDFSGLPGDYYYCSVEDILEGSYDPDMLAGAIVLIGPYDAAMGDSYMTAVDHAEQMHGVEYVANVLADMLNSREKQEVDGRTQLLLLFVLSFFMAVAIQRMSTGWSILFGGASVICVMAAADVLYRQGRIVHVLWYVVGAVLIFVLSFIVRYISAILEKRRVTRTFGRYVDPEIIRELLHGDKESLGLTGRLLDIAVLFVDIRGFTTLSEQLTPEQVVGILNQYLTLTSRCIKNQHGTLDKYVGDCTMAFWGAPIPCENPVWKACRAALDMEAGAGEITRMVKEKYGKTISFGIGVHYGPAVVGNIGSPERMDYTAIGDTVNTASRLESNAPAGTVYISRKVADILGSRAVTEALDHKLTLKGKAEGFEVLILKELKK